MYPGQVIRLLFGKVILPQRVQGAAPVAVPHGCMSRLDMGIGKAKENLVLGEPPARA